MSDHPPSRAYRTRVAEVRPLSPHFTRVTLTDPELAHFGSGGLDQRVKLLLPPSSGALPDVGLFDSPVAEWYPRWRGLPAAGRGAMRTYTVRAARPGRAQLDIDFVLHGTEGPASAWAAAARPGDELVVVGPDARARTSGGGIEWRPGGASTVLLAGDETAAPAICAILEALDETCSGHAYVEVPDAADVLDVRTRADVELHWLVRGGRPHGAALDAAVRAWAPARPGGATSAVPPEPDDDAVLWEVPDAAPAGARYAWLAGEAGVVTGLRRHLVRDLGVDRRTVAFMGYWRRGRAEVN